MIRTMGRAIAAAGVVLLAAACAQLPPPEPGPPGWHYVRSTGDNFETWFPGAPEFETREATAKVTNDTGALQRDTWHYDPAPAISYQLEATTFWPGSLPKASARLYGALTDGFAKAQPYLILRSRTTTILSGVSAVEAVYDDTRSGHDSRFVIDMVAYGEHLYMIGVGGPRRVATGLDAIRFRNAFHILARETTPREDERIQRNIERLFENNHRKR